MLYCSDHASNPKGEVDAASRFLRLEAVVCFMDRCFHKPCFPDACLGIGFSGGVVCLAAVLSNYFGTGPFASLSGLTIAINTTMGAIAPFLAGRLHDSGYGYQGVFYTVAVWCAAGAVIMFTIKPPLKNKVPNI